MSSKNPSTSRNKNRKNRRRNVSMLSTSKSKDALNGDRNFPYSLISNGTKNIKRINESPVFALTQGTRNDMEYCKEMSRKAIARAGLYLGVTSMDKDALGVLGDTLVDYLEKIGQYLAKSVQASNRTSAHCNVLDAFHAVEACTSPAVYQLVMTDENDDYEGKSTENDVARGFLGRQNLSSIQQCGMTSKISTSTTEIDRGWEGLACFLFGNDWLDFTLPGMECNNNSKPSSTLNSVSSGKVTMAGNLTGTGTGKQILCKPPSSTAAPSFSKGSEKQLPIESSTKGTASNISTSSLRKSNDGTAPLPSFSNAKRKGWNAPYPHYVQAFPIRYTDMDLDIHKLPKSIGISFHSLATKDESCRGDIICGSEHMHVRGKSNSEKNIKCRDKMKIKPQTSKGNIDLSAADHISTIRDEKQCLSSPAAKAEYTANWAACHVPDKQFYPLNNDNPSFWGAVGSLQNCKNKSHDNAVTSLNGVQGSKVGILKQNNISEDPIKRKRDNEDGNANHEDIDDSNISSPKRSKSNVNSVQPSHSDVSCPLVKIHSTADKFRRKRPGYIPSFFPALPPDHTYIPAVKSKEISGNVSSSMILNVEGFPEKNGSNLNQLRGNKRSTNVVKSNSRGTGIISKDNKRYGEYDGKGQQAVRASLVSLEQTVGSAFWGSMNNDPIQQNYSSTEIFTGGTDLSNAPPLGRAHSDQNTSSRRFEGTSVVSLKSASGSRISRILEGSEDVYQ